MHSYNNRAYRKVFLKKNRKKVVKIFAGFKNVPYLCTRKTVITIAPQNTGVVVQLVRIPACHAGGRGLESRPYRRGERRMSNC